MRRHEQAAKLKKSTTTSLKPSSLQEEKKEYLVEVGLVMMIINTGYLEFDTI
jgi:hypothetical protein